MIWVVERATGRVVDASEDGSIRYDERFFDHVDVEPAGAPASTPARSGLTAGVYTEDLPEHTHDDVGHSVTVLRGSIRLIMGGVVEQTVRRFETVAIPAGVAHAVTVLEPGTVYVNVSGSW